MKKINSNTLLQAAENNMEQFTEVAHAYQCVLILQKKLEKYQENRGISTFHEAEYDDFELSTISRINSGISIFAKKMFNLNKLFFSQEGVYIVNDNVTPFWKKKELFNEFDVFVDELTIAK